MHRLSFIFMWIFISNLSAQGLWDDVEQASSSSLKIPAISSSAVKLSSSSTAKLSSSSALKISSSTPKISSATLSGAPKPNSSLSLSSSSLKVNSSSSILSSSTPISSSSLAAISSSEWIPENFSSSAPSSSSTKVMSLQVDTAALNQIQSPSLVDQRALLGKIYVTKVESFGDSKEYRSPRKAMFLSLFVPGLGQAYVGGVGAWIRGLVYVGAEAALWTSWYQYSVVGVDDYQSKANALRQSKWSDVQYEETVAKILTQISTDPKLLEAFKSKYQDVNFRRDWCTALFGTNPSDNLLGQCEAQNSDQFLSYVRNSSFEPKNLPNHNTLIERPQMRWGWKDASWIPKDYQELKLDQSQTELPSSEAQQLYISYQDEIRSRREASSTFFSAIAINHLVSALDAALSAHSRNKKLYHKTSPLSFSAPMQWNGRTWHNQIQLSMSF